MNKREIRKLNGLHVKFKQLNFKYAINYRIIEGDAEVVDIEETNKNNKIIKRTYLIIHNAVVLFDSISTKQNEKFENDLNIPQERFDLISDARIEEGAKNGTKIY